MSVVLDEVIIHLDYTASMSVLAVEVVGSLSLPIGSFLSMERLIGVMVPCVLLAI